uniref:Uncharacterized protein n=1 Tax=Lepeophtheirus salmonis TaxID=72036 RepID=A0A0K2TBX8_LEPSM
MVRTTIFIFAYFFVHNENAYDLQS